MKSGKSGPLIIAPIISNLRCVPLTKLLSISYQFFVGCFCSHLDVSVGQITGLFAARERASAISPGKSERAKATLVVQTQHRRIYVKA